MKTPITTVFAKSPAIGAQQGISLIEAMVATLVLAILFLGLAHVLSRGLVSQRYVNTHNLALLEMRWNLERKNGTGLWTICEENKNPDNLTWLPQEVQVTNTSCVTKVDVEVIVDGLPPLSVETYPIPTLSTEANSSLFGGEGIITLSNQAAN